MIINRKEKINLFLLNQFKSEGIEVEEIIDHQERRGRGIQRINPLEKLKNAGIITQQEYRAARNYQYNYEIANISHHARPSYDGTGIVRPSSVNFKSKDTFYSQSQLNATNYIAKTRNIILQKDIAFVRIVELIFEKQKSITSCEDLLKMTKKTIEKKIKEICEIMLDNA